MTKIRLILATLFISLAQMLSAQSTEAEVTKLLHTFLDSVSLEAMHDRFWGEDLIYTSSAGTRFGKESIMAGFKEEKTDKASTDISTYSAEDIKVKDLNGVAVLTYRMIGTVKKADGSVINTSYLNSGTLVKHNGQWKVVNWHATKAAVEN
jgi:hypothetical protein